MMSVDLLSDFSRFLLGSQTTICVVDYLPHMFPAAVAITLAKEAPSLQRGDRVLMMGIGSGLNMTCLELEW